MQAQKENASFTHKPAFSAEVKEVIEPIFEHLTDDKLLTRCLGKNNQNNNECFNSLIWSIVPKHHFTSGKIVEIVSWISTCIFNERAMTLIKILETMDVIPGEYAYQYATKRD